MSEQSRVKFERVICKNNSRNIKKNENGEYELSPIAYAYSGWQSATAEANKRIAELEGEVAELKGEKVRHDQLVDYLKCGIAEELEQRISELQASNNDLREALEKVKAQNDKYGKDGHIDHVVVNALYSTPAESLQAHDDELIEKCAKVCIAKANELKELIDQDCIVGKADTGAIVCAQEIRALKGK